MWRKQKLKRNSYLHIFVSNAIKGNNCSIEKCSRKCDICKKFLVVSIEFFCHAKYKAQVQSKRYFNL